MPWIRSRVAWGAGLVALFALLRGLRRLVEPDGRPLALVLAIVVVVAVALLPSAVGRDRSGVEARQAGARKAVQFFGAAGVLLLAVLLGARVLPAAVLGLGAAALVPLLRWPRRAGRRPSEQG